MKRSRVGRSSSACRHSRSTYGDSAARLDSPDAYQQAIARAYRKVFASYSHKDAPVVESCETAARTMGDNYLRDVTLL